MEPARLLLDAALDYPSVDRAAAGLFLNAVSVPGLRDFERLSCQTFARDAFLALRKATPEVPPGPFSFVLCRAPKAMDEAEIFLAQGLSVLAPDGILMAAAANDAGGKRIAGLFSALGLSNVEKISKSRCTLCIARKPAAPPVVVLPDFRPVLDGAFLSTPGIFGWDQIDKGSALLARFLPADLSGTGADFGCGYGFLARTVREKCAHVGTLYCADSDSRAVESCRRNVPSATCLWLDLTAETLPEKLDFIVMNPPFHTGKKTDSGLGRRFIERAHAALRPGGALWMVANTHLPYESFLNDLFQDHRQLAQESGFKIIRALKS